MKILLGGAAMTALDWASLPLAQAGPSSHPKNVVILGIDGMDPGLVMKYVQKGYMPTFQKLMQDGSFSPLGTSIPPQSPVAWSNFITGLDPGGHGIFDFIHRDPENYFPEFSTSRVEKPKRAINIASWSIPLSRGRVTLLRKGTAFWEILSKNGIPCTVFKVPSNFPPVECDAKTLSGLGTPDLLGTYGTFSFFTDDPAFFNMDISGGVIYPVAVLNNKVETALIGPANTIKRDHPDLEAAFTVFIDKANQTTKIVFDDEELLLKVGEWSPWIQISFPIVGPLHSLKGICRFYLKSISPYFSLYASPLNIDPADPALPISTPSDYSRELYEKIGRFYTQGMAEETKGLEWGVLDDAEFIHQAGIVLEERLQLLEIVLDDYNGGLLFFYISTLDLGQHMLWRNMDPKHPGYTEEAARYHDQIEKYYIEMDRITAYVLKRIPDDATFVVMSDHGFSPFYKKFNLNTWLYQKGYLTLRDSRLEECQLLSNVSWRRTRAYGLGINGLYINLRGRESRGIVRTGSEYESLVNEIASKLLSVKDPENGHQVISHVYPANKFYHGEEVKNAPDLIIGYNDGYRNSNESALGSITQDLIGLNTSKWSGDHCMAPVHIPGTFISNRKLIIENPRLSDFAGTVLALYDMKEAAPLSSRPLFKT